jgi:hypothetical protein
MFQLYKKSSSGITFVKEKYLLYFVFSYKNYQATDWNTKIYLPRKFDSSITLIVK